MSHVFLYIHIVWGTKNREPLLNRESRIALFSHIRENAASKNIVIDRINGYLDHVHCLVKLGADQEIARTVMLLKGESSAWANKVRLLKMPLKWASEYYAASVGLLDLNIVRAYIDNQEAHHRKKTFADEYEEFLKGDSSL